tara:strand:- start:131 stop:772 length:642 start_codon:yes stop_codon:yes gene_type:complete
MLAILISLIFFVIIIFIYNLLFKGNIFRNELSLIRKKNAYKLRQSNNDDLISYLNLIIDDENVKIVKKYFYCLAVIINVKYFILSATLLFSFTSFSQEKNITKINSFSGHWGSEESNYYLTINDKDFITYKFVPYEDEDGCLSWNKVLSPGTEEFVKKEDNVIVTNYWIDEQEYYVRVTYTLLSDDDLNAEFNGKLNGDFYFKTISYKKVNFK